MTQIQAVIFKLDKIKMDEIIRFLAKLPKLPIKYHLTKNKTLRARLENPKNFNKFRTKKINDSISIVIGL